MSELVDMDDDGVLRVSGSSNTSKLAAAIAHAVYKGKRPSLRAVGAGAVNQAVKALAVAQSFVASRAIVLSFRVGFSTVSMPDDQTVTALVINVLVDD